jgi:ribulose-phosphate 3-epimerase
MVKLISASILSADFSNLGQQIRDAEKAGVDWLHFDVMDGSFVPNISFGIPVLKSIRPVSHMVFDVHLMIDNPLRYVSEFRDCGADVITVHLEAEKDIKKCLKKIRDSGAKAGISIKPGTAVERIYPLLPFVDLVLFMGVEPGFGGQKFNPKVLPKIKKLKKRLVEDDADVMVEVDGGVNSDTIAAISLAGADVFVAGSYIFGNKSGIRAAVSAIREKI